MKNFLFLTTSIITFVISFFGIWFVYYHIALKPISSSNVIVNFSVEEGNTFYSVADKLKGQNLIRSKFVYKLYVSFHLL